MPSVVRGHGQQQQGGHTVQQGRVAAWENDVVRRCMVWGAPVVQGAHTAAERCGMQWGGGAHGGAGRSRQPPEPMAPTSTSLASMVQGG